MGNNYSALVARTEKVKAYMQAALDELAALIAVAESNQPKSTPGFHGLVTSFTGMTSSRSVVDDYKNVQSGLKTLKDKYQKVYPKEFAYLDDDTIVNFGCLGVLDMFQSDLLTRLKKTQSMLQLKFNRNVKSLEALNDAVGSTAEVGGALEVAKDPGLRRYIDQTTKDEDLLATLDSDKDGWIANHRASYGSTGSIGVVSSALRWANYLQGDAVDSTVQGSGVIDALSSFTTGLQHAQTPLSSKSCSSNKSVSDSLGTESQAAIDHQAKLRKEAHEESVQSAFASDDRNAVSVLLDQCTQSVNKLDAATYDAKKGAWVQGGRTAADGFRKRIAVYLEENDATDDSMRRTGRGVSTLYHACDDLLKKIQEATPGGKR